MAPTNRETLKNNQFQSSQNELNIPTNDTRGYDIHRLEVEEVVERLTILNMQDFTSHDGYPLIVALDDEDSRCYAKRVTRGPQVIYYVKVNRAGFFYDPLNKEMNASWAARQREEAFRFQKVSPQVFRHYAEFLRTKNKQHLTEAQRGFI